MCARLPDVPLKDKTIFEDDEMCQGLRAHKQHQSPDANDNKFRKNAHEDNSLYSVEDRGLKIEDRKIDFSPSSILHPRSSIFYFPSPLTTPLSRPSAGGQVPVEAWRKTGHNRTNSSGLFALPPL